MSRVVIKLGGRVAAAAAAEALALREHGHDVVVVHGAGPQITARDGAPRNRARASSTGGA